MTLALVFFGVRSALANGAFPDEMSLFFPAGAPNQILLGTNFGVVVSEDAGQTWRYVCEPYLASTPADLPGVSIYHVGPDGSVFAAAINGLWRSTDGGCTWTKSGGSLGSLRVTDVFADPTDARFVLAIAVDASEKATGIHASADGGASFQRVYTTEDRLTGIELSRSSPGVTYATVVRDTASGPAEGWLLKSTDRFTSPPQIFVIASAAEPRLAAVDPEDSDTVYLRLLVARTPADAIAITTDGGATVAIAQSLTGSFFTSFLRASDGTLYAGTSTGELYVRNPGSLYFTRRPGPAPRTRCLGQRLGTTRLYACGDYFLDRYNLATSDDGARTFQPLMHFNAIQGLLGCPAVQTACASHWMSLQLTLGITRPPREGGAVPGSEPPAAPSPGCSSCSSVGAGSAWDLLLLVTFLVRRRRRRAPLIPNQHHPQRNTGPSLPRPRRGD